MDIVSLILIGIGLSFDSFAAAVSCGLSKRDMVLSQMLKLALVLALTQAIMPIIGWLVGEGFGKLISDYDHWVAFGLLALLGGKMIWDSFKGDDDEENDCSCSNGLSLRSMIGMGIATSIDALIVGISFALIGMNWHELSIGVIIIGVITYLAVILGVVFGKKTGHTVGKKADIAGGIILIAIGVKILIEHTCF